MKTRLFLLLALCLMAAACTHDYVRPPSPGAMIKTFTLAEGQVGTASVNISERKITVVVQNEAYLSKLKPIIGISDGATISPASGQELNLASTRKQQFAVTAESGKQIDWTVEFIVYGDLPSHYGVYGITANSNGKALQIAGDILFNQKYYDGQDAELATVDDNPKTLWQKWHLIYVKTELSVDYYQIRNLHSGKYLAATQATAGTAVEQERRKGTDAELWGLAKNTGENVYSIINKQTGFALTADTTSNTSKIVQAAVSGKKNQQWIFSAKAETIYRDDDAVSFFERNEQQMGSVAFDQGNSIPLNDGRVLWITQDAWDGTSLHDGMFYCNNFFSYNNSVLIQPTTTDWNPAHTPNMTITDNLQGRPRQIFSNQPNTDWSWPGPGMQIGNDVWVQCGEGKGLTATNQSLYKLSPDNGNQWKSVRYTPQNMSGQVDINYASGMVKGSDGYVYAFGAKSFSFGYGNNVHVARFPVSDPLKWTFWNGSSWADQPSGAESAKVATGLGTVAVSYINGKYVLMSMDQGFNCEDKRDIYIATATSPTGPFTPLKYVYTITEYLAGKYARYYTPTIHPESVNGRNELLLTYCLNFSGCGVESCQNGYLDPYYYRVKGIRLPYSILGL